MSALFIRLEDAVSRFLLAVIVVLVFLAAIGRSFGYPLIWSIDVAQMLFLWLSFLGANRAMRLKTHIGVDFFARKFGKTARWVIELALGVVTLAFLGALIIAGYKLTLLNWQRVYGDSGISYAFVTAAVPIGSALLAMTVLTNLVRALRTGVLVFYAEKSVDLSESQVG